MKQILSSVMVWILFQIVGHLIAQNQPNVVILLADDLGYQDVGL